MHCLGVYTILGREQSVSCDDGDDKFDICHVVDKKDRYCNCQYKSFDLKSQRERTCIVQEHTKSALHESKQVALNPTSYYLQQVSPHSLHIAFDCVDKC